ncbi:hypothetical protein DVA67_020465 [Solirubrobacter sp. CPCC 204708]|uniref:Six-cysteine peptide SCIFF n=1 Tax=Solirubrobacter deserti TaxID=2282478 RepID=A0ABT4RNX2_9ACTN|nr:hypothetical protein [Solirubrobacter deserti]MBE2318367.1 hypothetical protein [Solirubrobacter deserti]MDA0140113.1 hypothetical protein [Solirubrobacter deserti]
MKISVVYASETVVESQMESCGGENCGNCEPSCENCCETVVEAGAGSVPRPLQDPSDLVAVF